MHAMQKTLHGDSIFLKNLEREFIYLPKMLSREEITICRRADYGYLVDAPSFLISKSFNMEYSRVSDFNRNE